MNPSSRPAFVAHRSAFSLLELLVVIGILLVLIGLAVIGFKTVGSASKGKLTRNQLENCKSMLGEFTLTNQVQDLLPLLPVANNHWVVPSPTPATTDITTVTVPAPAPTSTNETNLKEDTARVIARLESVPANRQSLEKMPPDHISGVTYNTLAVTGGTLPASTTAVPVLLDGNGNPIYFIPGGGMTGVNLGYKGSGDHGSAASYDQPNMTVRSPDRRPFWASGGPDGDLTTGDDNVYSFSD